MAIGRYTLERYSAQVKEFHGSVAPGMLIGGFMVELAQQNTPAGEFFDVICETGNCLPDAIQLLTPCTIGNGWLKIENVGRYALTLYEKYTGEGVRVFLDSKKLEQWPAIQEWFYKLKPKMEQDSELLFGQIKAAGSDICSFEHVKVHPRFLEKRTKGKRVVDCPSCGEAYPEKDGVVCKACQGNNLYVS